MAEDTRLQLPDLVFFIRGRDTDLDELIATAAMGRILIVEYSRYSLPVPAYVRNALLSIEHEIRATIMAGLEKEESHLRSLLAALDSADYSRADTEVKLMQIQREKAALQAQDPPPATPNVQ